MKNKPADCGPGELPRVTDHLFNASSIQPLTSSSSSPTVQPPFQPITRRLNTVPPPPTLLVEVFRARPLEILDLTVVGNQRIESR
eukprot:9485856-Pyramimonas_sp.AAC.1